MRDQRFRHDCDECVSLGDRYVTGGRFPDADLYWCPGDQKVVARFADTSDDPNVDTTHEERPPAIERLRKKGELFNESPLVEAVRRSVEQGHYL